MKFRVIEQSYIDHTLHDEGAEIEVKPDFFRGADGKPLMSIESNLEPLDDEARAYAAEAARYFASLAQTGANSSTESDAVTAKVNELLGPLMQAMQTAKA